MGRRNFDYSLSAPNTDRRLWSLILLLGVTVTAIIITLLPVGATHANSAIENQAPTQQLTPNTANIGEPVVDTLTQAAPSHTINLDTGDGTRFTPIIVEDGKNFSEPVAPEREGATFVGWYTQDASGDMSRYDFSAPVLHDLTLFGLYAEPYAATNGNVVTPISLQTSQGAKLLPANSSSALAPILIGGSVLSLLGAVIIASLFFLREGERGLPNQDA